MIQLACDDDKIEAIYLISDGKPDTSIQLTLEQVEAVNKKHLPIHTISFNCDDRWGMEGGTAWSAVSINYDFRNAEDFMKLLSLKSGGRYHRCYEESNAQLAIHRLLEDCCVDEDVSKVKILWVKNIVSHIVLFLYTYIYIYNA